MTAKKKIHCASRQQRHGDGVVDVLGHEAAAQLVRALHVELLVALDRPRDLEAGRAQQAHAFPHLSVEGNHDLRREEAVVARLALRGIGDPVPQEVLCPDRHPGQAEGRVREIGIDDGQPVRGHRSAADRAEERGVVLDHFAEVRTGLPHPAKVVAQPTQVVDDVGGATEETHVEPAVGRAGDRAVDPVVESVQRVDLVRRDEEVQHARNGSHEHEADERGAEEEHGGNDQRRRGRTPSS